MPHSLNDEGTPIINLTDYSYLESVKHREKISKLCESLNAIEGIHYFSIDINFSNGKRYVVSNMPLWSVPYHTEDYIKASFVPSFIKKDKQNFIVHRDIHVNELQSYIWRIMAERYRTFPVFAMIKRSSEMVFVFQFFSNSSFVVADNLYCKNKNLLNKFCLHFISNMLNEIKANNPYYSGAKIWTDPKALARLILLEEDAQFTLLTNRELDCLKWLRNGKTAAQTATLLHMSPETVRTHIKTIRSKLKTANLVHTIAECIRLGYLS